MSLRSTTTFSSGQIYCCFTRCLSVRCSMLKEMPLLRAPENRRTGIEMRPKVKCPDQTDAAIIPLVHRDATTPRQSDCKPKLGPLIEGVIPKPGVLQPGEGSRAGNHVAGLRRQILRWQAARSLPNLPRIGSLAYKRSSDAQILGHGEPKCEAGGNGVGSVDALGVVVN